MVMPNSKVSLSRYQKSSYSSVPTLRGLWHGTVTLRPHPGTDKPHMTSALALRRVTIQPSQQDS